MKFEFYEQIIDFNDDVEINFLHEYLLYLEYKWAKERTNLEKNDKITRDWNKSIISMWDKKAKCGNYEFARNIVESYNHELFENVSDDYTKQIQIMTL